MPRKPAPTARKRRRPTPKQPPRLKVGDCIAYGPHGLPGTVIEDRGFIGVCGGQIVRVTVVMDETEPVTEKQFEIAAVMLQRRSTPPPVIATLRVPITIGLDATLLERAHQAINMHYLGRPRLKSPKETVGSAHEAASYAVHRSSRAMVEVELRADGSLTLRRR